MERLEEGPINSVGGKNGLNAAVGMNILTGVLRPYMVDYLNRMRAAGIIWFNQTKNGTVKNTVIELTKAEEVRPAEEVSPEVEPSEQKAGYLEQGLKLISIGLRKSVEEELRAKIEQEVEVKLQQTHDYYKTVLQKKDAEIEKLQSKDLEKGYLNKIFGL